MFVFARTVARIAHRGQTDKAGEDYFTGHLRRVMLGTLKNINTPRAGAVAVLHDVLEDTAFRVQDLWDLGVDRQVVKDVLMLTRHADRSDLADLNRVIDETYREYIDRIANSGSEIVIAVKMADLQDHLRDTTAISDSLVVRYERALAKITEAWDKL
jgi:(p)ppGpp synthase/HD superfamily hydrolase